MKYLFFIFLITLVSNVTFAQETEILESEKARFSACIQQDSARLYSLLDENLTYIHSNSLLESKATFIHSVVSGNIKYNSFEVQNENVQLLSRKTAIIVGLLLVKGTYKTSPYEVNLRYTSIYVKQKRKWKLRAWQSTKIQ